MSKKINRDEIDRFHDYDIYIPTRTIAIRSTSTNAEGESGIDSDIAQRTIKNLHILDSMCPEGDKPIHIILNSTGGDVLHGMAIYDSIKSCKNHVTIVARGSVMSIAAWILQAADHRVMSKNSRFMVHTGDMGLGSNHPEITRRWVKQFEKDEVGFEAILLEKIKVKKPKFTKSQVRVMLRFDTILTPEEALDLNLIDEIEP